MSIQNHLPEDLEKRLDALEQIIHLLMRWLHEHFAAPEDFDDEGQ